MGALLQAATTLSAALTYAARRWPILPCWWPIGGACGCPKGATCVNAGKHPIGKLVPNGLKDAATDPQRIVSWWQQCPRANVAIRTGRESGLVVLDIDPRHGGDELLRDLEDKLGKLPRLATVQTGGGGSHFYFAHPGGHVQSRNSLYPGIDLKADDAYVLAPPSLHVSGCFYAWEL